MQHKKLNLIISSQLSRSPRLKRVVSKLLYRSWQLRVNQRTKTASKDLDVNKILWVNPNQINYASPPKTFHIYRDRGKVVGGDWDLQVRAFDDLDVVAAINARFKHGKPWHETEFYRSSITAINHGQIRRGCRTQAEFDERCSHLDRIFADMRVNGYQSQGKIALKEGNPYKGEDEITVNIGRHGDLLFGDGRHRLAMAKILGITKVPTKVTVRHTDWYEFYQEVKAYAEAHNGQLYQTAPHPDLDDIPAQYGEEQFEMIRPYLPFTSGDLLDVDAVWGYYSHRFEELGFSCLAIEQNTENIYFLQKLKRSSNRQFRVFQGSIFDYQSTLNYDVVLAMNIFHYCLEHKESCDRLAALLQRLQTKVMFIQAPRSGDQQIMGSYQGDGKAFVDFVLHHSDLNEAICIGQTGDQTIYRLRNT